MKVSHILHWLLCLLATVVCATQAHIISKRTTLNDKLYVFVERDSGCISVDSIEHCPVLWKVSPLAAKLYDRQIALFRQLLAILHYAGDRNESCKNALNATFCGQAAPKCSDTDSSEDYGYVKDACQKIYSSCPTKFADQLQQHKLCDKVSSGKIAKPKCVTPPKIEGFCPQPKYKMPTDALAWYQRINSLLGRTAEVSLKKVNASSKCIARIAELQCAPIYCSDDEKYLLTLYTKEDCSTNLTRHCLSSFSHPSNVDLLMKKICKMYPDNNSTRQAHPATVGVGGPRPDSLLSTSTTVGVGGPRPGSLLSTSTTVGVGGPRPGSIEKPSSELENQGNTSKVEPLLVNCFVLLFNFILVKQLV